jgi:hypothetical protein
MPTIDRRWRLAVNAVLDGLRPTPCEDRARQARPKRDPERTVHEHWDTPG